MKNYTLPETITVKGVTVPIANMDCVAITQLVYEALAARLNADIKRVKRAEASLKRSTIRLGKTVEELESGQFPDCLL